MQDNIDDILVTNHAVRRFMERKLGFDFSDLETLFMLEYGIPSRRSIVDREFMIWVERHISLDVFRQALLDEFRNGDDMRFVVVDTRLVTCYSRVEIGNTP